MKKTSPSGDIANMDSLKIPKGSNTGGTGGSKPSGSVPITVRFNAGDECIDDIFQSFHNNSSNSSAGGGGGNNAGGGAGGGGGDSLSSSPSQLQHQQNAEEVNTRNNFLQGNFFNRKRSGSIEGNSPTSVGPNLIAALSSSDTNSVGTWKMIKGKVTQTIEDIKSSKSSNHQTTATITKGEPNEPDSDPDSSIINNPSGSDELTLDQALKIVPSKDVESDSDAEFELLYEGDEHNERSRLRRGLANLKSKVKAKSAVHQQHQQTHPSLSASTLSISTTAAAVKPMKKDTSPSRSEGSGTSSLRSTFMRKRRKQPIETAELASPSTTMPAQIPAPATGVNATATQKQKGIIAGKKDVEIESGVEMLEGMVPPAQVDKSVVDASLPINDKKQHNRDEMKLPLKSNDKNEVNDSATISKFTEELQKNSLKSSVKGLEPNKFNVKNVFKTNLALVKRTVRRLPYVTLLGLLLIMIMPLHEFLRGVLACLLTMTLLEAMWCHIQEIIERTLTSAEPERSKFEIPDYSRMSVFEVPAVEEHKTVKSYSGWMNEVNSYDPDNFHISMTKSVYVKLEGTMLRISNTNARIPKKIMWNEPPIDRKTIQFTDHRTYNLVGCRIEMLPLGLARKRYFNRKYPMQLIIKKCESKADLCAVAADTVTASASAVASKRPSADSLKEGSIDSIGKFADQKDSSKFFDARDSSCGSYSLLSPPTSLSKTQSSSESTEDRSATEVDSELDFASTIINSDLQSLLANVNPDADNKEMTSVPCGDETRLVLFSRGDREKEDWYRRFLTASTGEVSDQDLRLPNMRLIDDSDMQAAAVKAALLLTGPMNKADYISPSGPTNQQTSISNVATDDSKTTAMPIVSDNIIPIVIEAKADKSAVTPSTTITSNLNNLKATPDKETGDVLDSEVLTIPDDTFEGLLMSSCAARNPADYLRFMALYQNACNQSHIPVYKKPDDKITSNNKRQRRIKHLENELWKGVDQSLFLGPSGSVVWANVLVGRVLYSILNDKIMQSKIQDFLQKKLSSIKLPSFMEEVTITQIDLGNTPPLIHRISQPMMDERGTWLDADVTYEGLLHITVTTRLNLLRLKRQSRNAAANMHAADAPGSGTPTATNLPPINIISDEMPQNSTSNSSHDEHLIEDQSSSSAIYDSDAESSGHSSSDSDSPVPDTAATNPEFNVFNTSPGNARRIFRIVDRFAASNFFQYATELSYVQRAMENMRSNITLRVELKGLVTRGTLNIPPPPSDRIWLAFRAPPRVWISAKPAFGEKSVDWSIVTNVIENKLCEEVNKFLVYPNMVDVMIPLLGQPTYQNQPACSENE